MSELLALGVSHHTAPVAVRERLALTPRASDELLQELCATESIDEAVRTMVDHQLRRLPVIDGHRLVGVVSQADLARNLPADKVGQLVAGISA